MNYIKFKQDVSTEERITLLLRAARTFGVPVNRRIASETATYYSVIYTHQGEKKTLVLKLEGDDKALMEDLLR